MAIEEAQLLYRCFMKKKKDMLNSLTCHRSLMYLPIFRERIMVLLGWHLTLMCRP